MSRRWGDGYGDCDVSPGDDACLCCPKLWAEKSYCQWIPVDENEIREKVRKTLKEEECKECLKHRVASWDCGYSYPENKLKWSGQTRLDKVTDVMNVTEVTENDTKSIGS